MAVETNQPWEAGGLGAAKRGWRRYTHFLDRIGFSYRFTSITGRIVFLNIIAVAVLVGGILYLTQFRTGLIQTRVESLMTEGRLIAASIADKSADKNSNEPGRPLAEARSVLEAQLAFKINPEEITALIGHLSKHSGTRARVYDRDGMLLVDSESLYSPGQISRFDLPSAPPEQRGFFDNAWKGLTSLFTRQDLLLYKDIGAENGKAYHEVKAALAGSPTPIERVNDLGETIVSVGVPIQGLREVFGALMLSTRGGDIDQIIARERWGIVRMAVFVAAVTILASMLLAGTIAGPMHRLASAAERVRKSIKTREQIPDFTHRSDEIGYLSRALREMTAALYRRMDAIESFAADVTHELKNPLTSLRSAADTLPLVKTEEDRTRLVSIIQQDVRRLNRLINDISDASRLDTELARETRKPVNVASLLETICSIVNEIHRDDTPDVMLKIEKNERGRSEPAALLFKVCGHDSRLSQVINNLLDNAMSFSPPTGKIYVSARRFRKSKEIEILVEDEGPGIRPENMEKIFNRFYTDRPGEEQFGQNSGLGLHISRQIVTAHGGRIWAENRTSPAPRRSKLANDLDGRIYGARFVIRLPAI